jgi:hypothetical protein
VKIQKPEDEKYFKDIVLNDILEEISNETNDNTKHKTMSQKKYASTKRPSSKKILSFIIVFLLLLFMGILFISETQTKIDIKSTIQKKPITTQKWKMEKDRTDNGEIATPKTITKPLPLPLIKINTPIETKKEEKKPMVNEITERERAKKALKQQMLN